MDITNITPGYKHSIIGWAGNEIINTTLKTR